MAKHERGKPAHSGRPAELASVLALQAVLSELRAVGASSPRPTRRLASPTIREALTGLGYVAALQSDSAMAANLAEVGESALNSLRLVVQQWLAGRDGLPARETVDSQEKVRALAGFYDRASEHLRRLGGDVLDPPA